MKVRDLQAQLDGDDTVVAMPSGGLEIVGDDGRTLFSISLKDNVLRVDAGSISKHGGKILDHNFLIAVRASNCINIIKTELKQEGMNECNHVWAVKDNGISSNAICQKCGLCPNELGLHHG